MPPMLDIFTLPAVYPLIPDIKAPYIVAVFLQEICQITKTFKIKVNF